MTLRFYIQVPFGFISICTRKTSIRLKQTYMRHRDYIFAEYFNTFDAKVYIKDIIPIHFFKNRRFLL